MVWNSTDARDIPPGYIKQKCHIKRDIRSVTCVICDSGFCKSVFVKKVAEGKGFFVTRHLIVCPAHPNLTYDVIGKCHQTRNCDEESFTLNRILCIIQKQLDNIAKGLNTTQEVEIIDHAMEEDDDDNFSIASDKSKKRKLDTNTSDKGCDECSDYLKDLCYEKKMNCELSKQNDELREHNNFLRSMITKPTNNLNQTSKSYSQAITSFPENKQESFQLVIKPRENFNGDALNLIKTQVADKTNAKVLKINKSENGTVFVKCCSSEDSAVITETLVKENNNILSVNAVEKKNPQIKITNMLSEVDKEELANDIIKRNQLPQESVTVLYTFKQKTNKKYAAVVEVTQEVYAKIMKTQHVFIRYQSCKIYDNYNISRCKNCCGFNHSLRACKEKFKRPQCCCKCSGLHDTSQCNANFKKCINCISANKYLTKKRSVEHAANELDKCDTYKAKWEQYVNSINYPWKPDPPFKTITSSS